MTKQEKVRSSIENRFILLRKIVSTPEEFKQHDHLFTALATQGNLCKLNITITADPEQLVITPISLNTLKKWLSKNNTGDNFEHLDKLRLRALQELNKPANNNQEQESTFKNRTRSSLEFETKNLKSKISELHAVNMVLIQALEVNRRDLLSISRTVSDSDRQQRIEKSINRIIKILSINPAPFDDISLLSMKPSLQVVNNEKKNR